MRFDLFTFRNELVLFLAKNITTQPVFNLWNTGHLYEINTAL
ncbi:hypothetical protein N9J52_00950 [Flavobacteriales bacterium]|nr:hypothetical protein [Flavobacteriales bacterium]